MKPVPLTEQEETYQNDKKFIAGEHGKGFELTIPLKTFYGAYADIRGDILPEDVEGVFKCVYTMNNGGIEIQSYGMPIGGIYSEEEEKRFNAKLLNELMTDDKYSETAEKINHWKAVLKRIEDFESEHPEGLQDEPGKKSKANGSFTTANSTPPITASELADRIGGISKSAISNPERPLGKYFKRCCDEQNTKKPRLFYKELFPLARETCRRSKKEGAEDTKINTIEDLKELFE